MSPLAGKYVLEKQENFEDYLRELGKNLQILLHLHLYPCIFKMHRTAILLQRT